MTVDILSAVKNEVEQILESKHRQLEADFLKKVEEIKPKSLKIVLKDITHHSSEGHFHNKFDEVLKTVNAVIPTFLTGDAGSGKTTIGEQVAKALKLPYYCISVCVQTSETSFLGYKNAHGIYVPTLFRKAYEEGGIFLLDEIDNGNPNILSVLNSALSNSICAFPDGMIKKHEDFRLIATGNTIGRGANRKYVGRLEMDAATLDRFAVITIDYDENIELILGDKEIVDVVQKIRKIVHKKNIRLIISPRATLYMTKLVRSGIKQEQALEMCIYKGCDESVREQLKAAIEETKKKSKGSSEIRTAELRTGFEVLTPEKQFQFSIQPTPWQWRP